MRSPWVTGEQGKSGEMATETWGIFMSRDGG